MKKLVLGMIGIFFIAAALALTLTQTVTVEVLPENKDVAYIYSSEAKIDDDIVFALESEGFNISFVDEKNFPMNLSSYRFIFIGDENYRKAKILPIDKYPSIIINHQNAFEFGLGRRNGMSQAGASSPLTVRVGENLIRVYNSAFKSDRLTLNYYYLKENNAAPSLAKIAGTKPSSSGINIGSVIAYAEAGDVLLNGKTAQKNICYFGLVEAGFWTEEAKQLFNNCVDFVLS
jgi:hypothetical protein